jgi:hypothetical protein
MGVSTTLMASLDVSVGVVNKRGIMDGSKKTSGDETEPTSTQVQGPSIIKVLKVVAVKVQKLVVEMLGPTTT